MGVSAQKFCNSPGALPTGTPGQEPGNGAFGVWMTESFSSKFFYEIDFSVFAGVLARVSPDTVPSTPVDLIQQTGLFPKFPRVKEGFKLLGLNSSPGNIKRLPCNLRNLKNLSPHAHTHTHKHIPIHTHTYIYTPIHIYIHAHVHTQTHRCTHSYTHSYTCTHIHAHFLFEYMLFTL